MKFSAKLNGLTITLLIVCMAILGGISWYFLEREVRQSRFRYANEMAELLISDPNVAIALHTGDKIQLTTYFDELVKRQKNLLFIALVKHDGTFLADTSRGEAARVFDWKTLTTASGSRAVRGVVRRDQNFRGKSDDVYLALLPIFSQGALWGHAALGYSFKELFRVTLPKIFMLLTGLWLGLAAVCSLVLFVFVHSLTRPIRDLMLGVRMISTGYFDFPVQVKSRDELGALAGMFDQMRQSLRETFARLQKLSPMDEITHIYNENFFRTLLEQELARARRYRYPITLLLVRLTNFEALRQGYAGEFKSALAQVSRSLQGCIRNTDNLARYREDTFAMVLAQSDRKGSQPVIERIRTALREFRAEGSRDSMPAPMGLIGLATLDAGGEAVTMEQLLAQAENELGQA